MGMPDLMKAGTGAGQATMVSLCCTRCIAAVGTAATVTWSLPNMGITPPQKGFSHPGAMADLAK